MAQDVTPTLTLTLSPSSSTTTLCGYRARIRAPKVEHIRAIHLIIIYCPWWNRISKEAYDQTLDPWLYCAKWIIQYSNRVNNTTGK